MNRIINMQKVKEREYMRETERDWMRKKREKGRRARDRKGWKKGIEIMK